MKRRGTNAKIFRAHQRAWDSLFAGCPICRIVEEKRDEQAARRISALNLLNEQRADEWPEEVSGELMRHEPHPHESHEHHDLVVPSFESNSRFRRPIVGSVRRA